MFGLKGFLTTVLTRLALLLICGYQRWLSPYKGFHCAYRVYVGGSEGCSGYGQRVIRRYGIFTGYRLLQRRLWRCGEVAAMQREQRLVASQVMRAQAGDCDLGGCDLGGSSFDGCDSFGLPDGCDSCDVIEFLTDLWPEPEEKKKPQRKWRAISRPQVGHCDMPSIDVSDVLDCVPDSCSGCGSSRAPKRQRKKYQPLPRKI